MKFISLLLLGAISAALVIPGVAQSVGVTCTVYLKGDVPWTTYPALTKGACTCENAYLKGYIASPTYFICKRVESQEMFGAGSSSTAQK
jgi:hypothetical protein